jgi:hypothetical protein
LFTRPRPLVRHRSRQQPIQIFDQDGKFIATWQFGRPSGIYIGADDVMYVVDSESVDKKNPSLKDYGFNPANKAPRRQREDRHGLRSRP